MNEDHIKYKKMIDDTDKRVKGLIAKWVLRYDYFGFLFSLVRRKAEVGLRNPACITPTDQGTLELLYNPILISATPDEDLNEILHHEGLHILNKHISRMMRILADMDIESWDFHRKLINVACDCCVNFQGKIKNPLMIAGSPFKLHFPKDHNLPNDRMMEEYYYTLLDRKRKNKNDDEENDKEGDKSGNEDSKDNKNMGNGSGDQNSDKSDNSSSENPQHDNEDGNDKKTSEGSGSGETDKSSNGPSNENEGNGGSPTGNPLQMTDNSDLGNHVQWTSENIADPHALSRIIDTYTQRIIRDSAMNFQRSKNKGNLPGYIQDLIQKALEPPPIPYYELVRQLVRGSKLGKYKRSLTHVNRKRTYVFQLKEYNIPMISPFPGRKRDESFKIGVLVDTSGSQTPDDILDALSGCANLIEKDPHCETTILEVDTIIHKEYKLKKLSDLDFDVKGRGGTTLMPGIKRCKELNVDICICFTDGITENFNEIDRKAFPKRMLWVITPNGNDKNVDKVGYTVFLPERKN